MGETYATILCIHHANPEIDSETVNPFLPSSPCLPDDRNSILVRCPHGHLLLLTIVETTQFDDGQMDKPAVVLGHKTAYHLRCIKHAFLPPAFFLGRIVHICS